MAVPIPQVKAKTGSVWEDMSLAAKRFGELDDALGVAKKLHLDATGQAERTAEPLMSARRSAETVLTNARHQLSGGGRQARRCLRAAPARPAGLRRGAA